MASANISNREEEWDYCARCGFRRSEYDLVWQRGKKVCIQTCYDDPEYKEADDE